MPPCGVLLHTRNAPVLHKAGAFCVCGSAWRGVYISEPARLSLSEGRLQVGDKGNVPLEDVAYIILDTQQATLSAALLAACAAQSCAVITTDEKHLPNGVLLGFHPYHRQAETVQAQLALSLPRKKRLWQRIIQAKIINQSLCLRLMGRTAEQVEKIRCCADKVSSNDASNMEATAARLYWSLYAPGFRRRTEEEDRLNALLNYGYAVLRSLLARDAAALGFIPCLGIRHCNLQNPFNLADDLVEPWRAFVDRAAWDVYRETPGCTELCPADKQRMAALPHQDVEYAGETCALQTAAHRYVSHVRAYIMQERDTVPFPTFSRAGARSCPRKEADSWLDGLF